MLQAGWMERDYREMLGQVPRILAALLFSKVWVPEGNTGRARVSAFRPMPISAELKQLLQGERRGGLIAMLSLANGWVLVGNCSRGGSA
ncbi:hypothetical protein D9M68_969370 [compost metagenome]